MMPEKGKDSCGNSGKLKRIIFFLHQILQDKEGIAMEKDSEARLLRVKS